MDTNFGLFLSSKSYELVTQRYEEPESKEDLSIEDLKKIQDKKAIDAGILFISQRALCIVIVHRGVPLNYGSHESKG